LQKKDATDSALPVLRYIALLQFWAALNVAVAAESVAVEAKR